MGGGNDTFNGGGTIVVTATMPPPVTRPNILLCMADDWGYPHASAYHPKESPGDPDCFIQTPGFDRIADEGVLFRNAFSNVPSCTPTRGCTLTGRYPWTLEEGSTLWGPLPAKFIDYPSVFGEAGYKVGFTGKGWGPGTLLDRPRNPAGPAFNSITTEKQGQVNYRHPSVELNLSTHRMSRGEPRGR